MRSILAVSILLAACGSPQQAAESAPAANGATLIVLNKSEATASLIDASSGETLAVVPTGTAPHETS